MVLEIKLSDTPDVVKVFLVTPFSYIEVDKEPLRSLGQFVGIVKLSYSDAFAASICSIIGHPSYVPFPDASLLTKKLAYQELYRTTLDQFILSAIPAKSNFRKALIRTLRSHILLYHQFDQHSEDMTNLVKLGLAMKKSVYEMAEFFNMPAIGIEEVDGLFNDSKEAIQWETLSALY
jgi:hypothetical protein